MEKVGTRIEADEIQAVILVRKDGRIDVLNLHPAAPKVLERDKGKASAE